MHGETHKNLACILSTGLALTLLSTGCANDPTSARRGSSEYPMAMVLDTADLQKVSESVLQSLLESKVFDRAPHHPALLAMGRIENRTSQSFDTSSFAGLICAPLLQTGKVVALGKKDDGVDVSTHADAVSRPDFTLSGRVVETSTRRGNIKESTYVFQFSLVNNNRLAVWEANHSITKLGKRAGVSH